MAEVAIELIFCLCAILIIGMFAVFCLCMYLREFPKIKHNIKADLGKNTYETQTEVDKSEDNKK